MRPATLDILHEEHAALAVMLGALSAMLARARHDGVLPDFEVLRAVLFYLDAFAGQLHHHKESEWLFPAVRERCPELAPVLDRLERDHAESEKTIRELEHSLLAFEVLGEPRRRAFEEAVEPYIRAYLEHIAVEERDVLPTARLALGEADWALLDAVFSINRDPITGHEPEAEFKPLFRKLLHHMPARAPAET